MTDQDRCTYGREQVVDARFLRGMGKVARSLVGDLWDSGDAGQADATEIIAFVRTHPQPAAPGPSQTR